MKLTRFSKYAWLVLFYNLAVIVWGAYVRASGSGAGCGSHWPLCNGEVIPRDPRLETIIEFAHRVTSGLAIPLLLVLLVWAFRKYPRRHPARLGASLSMFFIITEALVGAGLVLFEYVAHNASAGRVNWMAAHLINTFLLLASLALTAWWGSGGAPVRLSRRSPAFWSLAAGLVGVLLIGVTGALTALGDTLFPAASLQEGLLQDFSPTAHFLLRLRPFHPLIAILVGFYLIVVSLLLYLSRPEQVSKRFALALSLLFMVQLLAGVINLALLAPIPMQLAHLLLADLVWVTLMLLTANVLADRPVTETVEAGTLQAPLPTNNAIP